jgi:hypothetical protein
MGLDGDDCEDVAMSDDRLGLDGGCCILSFCSFVSDCDLVYRFLNPNPDLGEAAGIICSAASVASAVPRDAIGFNLKLLLKAFWSSPSL